MSGSWRSVSPRHKLDDIENRLKSTREKVHRKRFGTVAFATRRMLRTKEGMQRFWSKELYTDKDAPRADNEEDHEYHQNIDLIDQYVTTPVWWGELLIFHVINRFFRRMFAWAEWCYCHWPYYESSSSSESDSEDEHQTHRCRAYPAADPDNEQEEKIIQKFKRLWKECPMRGTGSDR